MNQTLKDTIMQGIEGKYTPKTMNDRQIEIYASGMGMAGMPHSKVEGLDNAAYISPGDIDENVIREYKIKKAKRKIAERIGAMVYEKGYNISPIVAHELGHASIENEEGVTLHKSIQKIRSLPWYVKYPINAIGGLGGIIGGAALGGAFTGASTAGVIAGAGLGGVVGDLLVSGAPTLLNEHEASNRANIYLDSRSKDPGGEVRKAERQVLKNAYKTYIVGALGSAAVTGALGAYIATKGSMMQ